MAIRSLPIKDYISQRWDCSSDTYDSHHGPLPNAGGTSPERAREYLAEAGFKNVEMQDLGNIVMLQKSMMPFRNRIAYNYRYYLISGEK